VETLDLSATEGEKELRLIEVMGAVVVALRPWSSSLHDV